MTIFPAFLLVLSVLFACLFVFVICLRWFCMVKGREISWFIRLGETRGILIEADGEGLNVGFIDYRL